jgi:NDP-sugar pyrophosphorylase family protein
MADIKGVPFLDILIDQLRSWGGRRFILLAGYLGRQIKEYYALRKIDGVEVVPVVEKRDWERPGR